MDRLAVIILNYRTAAMSIECAEAVLPELSPTEDRLIIVENGSGDGSDAALKAWRAQYPEDARIDIIVSAQNRGFAGGNNIGLAASRARFALLQNSDAFVQPGAIARLLDAAGRTPAPGIVHPELCDPDGTPQISRFRRFTPLTELITASRLDILARIFSRHVTAIPLASSDAADWVSFASVLLSRAMLDQIGPMDDGFFLYYEDSEFCERARRAGWTMVYVPEAKVVHRRGGSSPVKRLTAEGGRLPAYFYESRSRYYRLHYGVPGLIAANLLWYVGRGLGLLRLLALKPPAKVCAHAGTDIWRGFLKGDAR